MWADSLAQENSWTKVAYLTYTPHISRTGLYLNRCATTETVLIDAQVRMNALDWAYRIPYEVVALVKAQLVTNDC